MNNWNSILDKHCNSNMLPHGCQSDMKYLTKCLNFIISDEKIMNDINFYIEASLKDNSYTKSSIKSVNHRKRGNILYETKDLYGAIYYYSKAIICAACDSIELSLAYSNRSAALYHKKEWKSCIADINNAFFNGFPKNKQFKLNKRLAYCWFYLGKVENAKNIVSNIEENLEAQQPFSAQDLDDFKSLKKKLQDNQQVHSIDLNKSAKSTPAAGNHLEIAFASKKINFIVGKLDRSILSNTNIEAGDILFIEPAFTSVTLHKSKEKQFICDDCCNTTYTPIPCSYCCDVVYCTNACKSNSWEKYHNWECIGSQNKFWKKLGIGYLATRMLILGLPELNHVLCLIEDMYFNKSVNDFNLETVLDRINYIQNEKDCKNLMKESVPRYAFVLSLITNIQHIDKEDFSKYCLTAVLLTSYFKRKTTFFDYIMKKNKAISIDQNQWFILSSAIMVQHLCQIICNAHTISASEERTSVADQSYSTNIASALYPLISIMNHSCNPNITTSFSGTTQIVRARCSIKKGEEIFNCYGPDFRNMSYNERQSLLLSQYHFLCKCAACTDPRLRN